MAVAASVVARAAFLRNLVMRYLLAMCREARPGLFGTNALDARPSLEGVLARRG
jgi:hypothetical protein